MNRQLIFDRVMAHGRAQKRKSTGQDIDGQQMLCLYREDRTARCACRCFLGALIVDERYKPELESSSVMQLSEMGVFQDDLLIIGEPSVSDITFLLGLQGIHDRRDVRDWEEDFRTFARAHRLTYREAA